MRVTAAPEVNEREAISGMADQMEDVTCWPTADQIYAAEANDGSYARRTPIAQGHRCSFVQSCALY